MGKSTKPRNTTYKRRLFSRSPRNCTKDQETESSPDNASIYSIVRLLAELEALECLTEVQGVNIAEKRVIKRSNVSMCVVNNKAKRKPKNIMSWMSAENNKPKSRPNTNTIFKG